MKLIILMSETKAFQKMGTRLYSKPFPGCEHTEMFTDAYFECLIRHTTQTIYHPIGTAKMGPYWDPDAVVDPQLR
jgi:choline dehydrogenase-like flavoprotein